MATGSKVKQSEMCAVRKKTSADTDLSVGTQGLHKGLRTEDVTSDRAAECMQTFSRSSGANGGWGTNCSSFLEGGGG